MAPFQEGTNRRHHALQAQPGVGSCGLTQKSLDSLGSELAQPRGMTVKLQELQEASKLLAVIADGPRRQTAHLAQIGSEGINLRLHPRRSGRFSLGGRSLGAQKSLQNSHRSAGSDVARNEIYVGGFEVLQS
jgi:hypothetical protein